MSDGRVPHRRHWVGVTIALLVTAILIALGWIAVRGLGAINDLNRVSDDSASYDRAIANADLEKLEPIEARLTQHSKSARSLTSDPVWRAFEIVPWLGADLAALREVAEITDDLAAKVVQPLSQAAAELDLSTLGFDKNPLDFAAFESAQAPLDTAATLFSDAAAKADRISTSAAIPAFSDAVQEMQTRLRKNAAHVGALHNASLLLPTMLGREAPRLYLVTVQNDSTTASVALVGAQSGTVTALRTISAADLPDAAMVLTAPDASADVAALWQQHFGEVIDGVITLDLGAAAHLLEATGELTVTDFTIDSSNVEMALSSPAYLELADEVQLQQVFTASTALLVEYALAAEPNEVIEALAQSGDEGRIAVWSAHEEEQKLLDGSSLVSSKK